jgi:hypothetical protein
VSFNPILFPQGVYYIVIGGYGTEEGSFSFDIACAISKGTISSNNPAATNNSSKQSKDDAIGLVLLGATGMGLAMLAIVAAVVALMKLPTTRSSKRMATVAPQV